MVRMVVGGVRVCWNCQRSCWDWGMEQVGRSKLRHGQPQELFLVQLCVSSSLVFRCCGVGTLPWFYTPTEAPNKHGCQCIGPIHSIKSGTQGQTSDSPFCWFRALRAKREALDLWQPQQPGVGLRPGPGRPFCEVSGEMGGSSFKGNPPNMGFRCSFWFPCKTSKKRYPQKR